jgi:hypothetical protein
MSYSNDTFEVSFLGKIERNIFPKIFNYFHASKKLSSACGTALLARLDDYIEQSCPNIFKRFFSSEKIYQSFYLITHNPVIFVQIACTIEK